MEESIASFRRTTGKFCNHLESRCSALRESVERRRIPIDSASTTFVRTVSQRASSVARDLNVLEAMSFGTVSFEELLGHCREVFNRHEDYISACKEHLGQSEYSAIFDEGNDVDDSASDDSSIQWVDSELNSNDREDDYPLLDESLCLKSFGISDVSLETIASQGGGEFEVDEPEHWENAKRLDVIEGEKITGSVYSGSRHLLSVSRDDYESLPKHMKSFISWEDLLAAVEKINSLMGMRATRTDAFRQNEVELLGLGPKARSYLLLLIKMDRLCVETSDGVITYRVL